MNQEQSRPLLEHIAEELGHYWWALLLRGVLAIALAVIAFVWPGLTLAALVIFIGAWFLIDGVFTVVHGFKAEKKWPHFLYGALGIAAGLITLFSPGLGAVALLFVVAFWAIFKGVMEISLAIRLRKEIEGEWLLVLIGALSILFGALLLLRPDAGLLAVVWIVGLYALFFGILLTILAFKVRSWRGKVEDRARPAEA